MSWLRIKTEGGRTAFHPGETLAGTADWKLAEDERPAKDFAVELRLLWETESQGTSNIAMVDSVQFESPSLEDSRSFAFELPAGPYSFDGRLIHLGWALEAVVGTETLGRMEITVSPTGEPVTVGARG